MRYIEWKKRQESLSYLFKNEMTFIEGWGSNELNVFFDCQNNDHPRIIKMFLRGEISLETLLILNSIFNFMKRYDKRITDPVYKGISQLCRKYHPFLKIDLQKQKKQLRQLVIQ